MKLMITKELDTTTLNPIRVMQDPYPGVTQIHTCIFVPLAPTIGFLAEQTILPSDMAAMRITCISLGTWNKILDVGCGHTTNENYSHIIQCTSTDSMSLALESRNGVVGSCDLTGLWVFKSHDGNVVKEN
ncbi:hypothetical protein GmHk_16G046005 [Glycine max]|nr:hypothetical protein GmHk_16G046005 [Glycine max]